MFIFGKFSYKAHQSVSHNTYVIPSLNDEANITQTSSKRQANIE